MPSMEPINIYLHGWLISLVNDYSKRGVILTTLPETNSSPMKIPIKLLVTTIKLADFHGRPVSFREGFLKKRDDRKMFKCKLLVGLSFCLHHHKNPLLGSFEAKHNRESPKSSIRFKLCGDQKIGTVVGQYSLQLRGGPRANRYNGVTWGCCN